MITKNGVSVVNICWLNELQRADTMQYSVLIKKKMRCICDDMERCPRYNLTFFEVC